MKTENYKFVNQALPTLNFIIFHPNTKRILFNKPFFEPNKTKVHYGLVITDSLTHPDRKSMLSNAISHVLWFWCGQCLPNLCKGICSLILIRSKSKKSKRHSALEVVGFLSKWGFQIYSNLFNGECDLVFFGLHWKSRVVAPFDYLFNFLINFTSAGHVFLFLYHFKTIS